MFSMPKKALYKPISRRKFLELGGGVTTVLGAGSIAVGMNSVKEFRRIGRTDRGCCEDAPPRLRLFVR